MGDLKFAIRQLLKSPGFTAVAVLTLALGIGANTVVFSVARTVLLRPLGFDGEDRLMWIRLRNTATGATEHQLSWREMEDLRSGTRSFESVATFGAGRPVWDDGDESGAVPAIWVMPDLMDALRLRPVLGRTLLPTDSAGGDEAVALISYELWQTRFEAKPEVLGQTAWLDQKPHTIVGVLPAGLQFPVERAPSPGTGTLLQAGQRSFWLSLREPGGADRTSRGARMFLAVGRLNPGVTEASALAGLALGLALSFATNRLIASQLFGVSPYDPILLGTVGVTLLFVALLASSLPARRAAKVDPVEALRSE